VQEIRLLLLHQPAIDELAFLVIGKVCPLVEGHASEEGI
jgi:hypothetical protein